MGSVEVIKRFIESNWIIERGVREVLERLPLRFRYGISFGPTFRYLIGLLRESERWDRDRLEAYQLEQLRDLLSHAGKNVPYYRKVFSEYGFKPKNVQTLEDINGLPYLDRIMVKKNHKEFVAENIPEKRLIPANTSGTSGIPLVIYGTKETEEKHWATIVDLWSRVGFSPSSKTVFFEANIRHGKKENLPWKRYANKLIISSNYFVGKWIDRYIEMINKLRPEYFVGFPHTIATFALCVKKSEKSFFDGLKAIIVYAENVYPWQRKLIKDVFGARIFADYGMAEKVIHGGGCERSDAYHFYPQYGYTEYLNIRNSTYELIGTGFINYAMPLIRYRTGDICTEVIKWCSDCGRAYDIVSGIEGRIGDFLINADGQIVSINLSVDFNILKNVKRFQLYQEYAGKVELRIWPDSTYRGEHTEKILTVIKQCLGLNADRINFSVTVMDEKETQLYKKYRMVDQRLDIRNFLE